MTSADEPPRHGPAPPGRRGAPRRPGTGTWEWGSGHRVGDAVGVDPGVWRQDRALSSLSGHRNEARPGVQRDTPNRVTATPG